jgi:hypothetical protein
MNGGEVVEEKNIGGYDVFLMRFSGPLAQMFFHKDEIYQIGVQKLGETSFSYEGQHKKVSLDFASMLKLFNARNEIKQLISGWIEKHGELYVSSMNDAKASKWQTILKNLLLGFSFKLETMNVMGQQVTKISK